MKPLSEKNVRGPMKAVLQWIQEHYAEDISPEKLAKQFNLTSSQLSRSFYEAFQVSPINCLIDFRLEKAKELLAAGSLSVEEAAEQVGFEDFLHFHNLFTNRLGQTPEEFRKEAQAEKKAAESAPPEEEAPEETADSPEETANAPEAEELSGDGAPEDAEELPLPAPQEEVSPENSSSPEALQAEEDLLAEEPSSLPEDFEEVSSPQQ